jgi:transposase
MIPAGVEIYVALEPVDMRLSFDRLAGLAKEQVGYDARSGALFLFFGKRRDALKVLFFDGSASPLARNDPPSLAKNGPPPSVRRSVDARDARGRAARVHARPVVGGSVLIRE